MQNLMDLLVPAMEELSLVEISGVVCLCVFVCVLV